MAGIYIHIPFCKKACHYCNFHFSTTHHLMPQMLEAINKEISLRKNELSETVDTIYFGGGTPSLCNTEDIQCIMNALRKYFTINIDAEVTLEANPDDITEQKLNSWKCCGINRLSIGIQSFNEEELVWMNRAHNATQATNNLQLALQYFNNISVDLIYGTPLLTNQQWLENLQTVAALNIPHISCYALTVEEGTALNKMILQGKKQNTNTNKQAEHFEMLMQWAFQNNYQHYEISNFAKPNFKSQHNSGYWQGKNYLGIGPSAHSYNGKQRKWNIANNALYIKNIEQNIVLFEEETLTATQQLNEFLMIALRTNEGICFTDERWEMINENYKNKIIEVAKKWSVSNHLLITENNICLTNKGKFLADGIASDLFQLS
ncbi:MAG: radical SAM family heme chaperone HemW [Bacteroidetes bacterium]|nr:radical SAM family heme chaperone HemW [Bacteroidota bacterium]MBS1648521.1 radical SAM family heme chaperone HemW [Bacteroidota bacterium]